MKRTIADLLLYGGLVVALLTMLYAVIEITAFRFAHPLLTETQLTIALWPWSAWVLGIVFGGVVLHRIGFEMGRKRR